MFQKLAGLVLVFLGVVIFFAGMSACKEGKAKAERDAGELDRVAAESFEDQMRKELNQTRLPELELNNTTLGEAIEFLRLRSVELSPEKDPRMRGFGFIVRGARVVSDELLEEGFREAGLAGELLSVSARDVGIAEALDLICEEVGWKWWVDEEILKIVISKNVEELKLEVKADPDDCLDVLAGLGFVEGAGFFERKNAGALEKVLKEFYATFAIVLLRNP